jgi:hypothetical protein
MERDIRFRLKKIAIHQDRDSRARPGYYVTDEHLARRKKESHPYDLENISEIRDIRIDDEVAITETGRLKPEFLKTSPVTEVFNGEEFNQSVLKAAHPEFIFIPQDDEEFFQPDEPGNFVRILMDRGYIKTRTSFYVIEKFEVKDRRDECLDKEKTSPSVMQTTDLSSPTEQVDS